MKTRQHKEQLLKIQMLSYLAEPEHRQFGAHGDAVRHGARKEGNLRGVDGDKMLKALVDEGLVERRTDPTNKNAKPYFITDEGSRFLEQEMQKAIFPDSATKSNWAGERSERKLEDAISDHLRTLQEFANAGDDRIGEVSLSVSQAVRDHISRAL